MILSTRLQHGNLLTRSLYVIVTGFCIVSCSESVEEKVSPLFVDVPKEQTHVDFENNIRSEPDFNILNYRNFYNGGGVAIGDINNDSLPDVFLISNMADNRLYLNKGNFEFEDITEKAGIKGKGAWSTGVTFADVNADGFLDIYVCNSGNRTNGDRTNELFINNGNSTFTESAKTMGLDDSGFTTHAAFFDYDRDGDLDAYILNNSFIPISKLSYRNLRNERDSLGGDKLLRNDNGKFVDVSEQSGIFGSLIGFGLGITVGDINNDNWLDIYVSNDFYEHDYLYINNQDGTFSEQIKEQMGHLSLASMGADLADINNDGALDLFVTDMLPGDDRHLKQIMTFENYDLYTLKLSRDYLHQITQNSLQINNQDGTFSEVSRMAGVEATDWSWGALLLDMDNDGWKDIFVSNGIAKDLTDIDFLKFLADETQKVQSGQSGKLNYETMISKMPSRPLSNYAFRNKGDLQFENVSQSWGLKGPGFSNGAAYGDLDNDGDLDVVVNNVNSVASIFRNTSETRGKHFISFVLDGPAKNRFGIGTRIKIYQGKRELTFEQMPARGFQSSVDYKIVAGLGDERVIDSVVVRWPDDRTETLKGLKANANVIVKYGNASQQVAADPVATSPLLKDITSATKLGYTHKESAYVDYYRDPLLKQMYSTEGPGLATGDVNGDGLEDIVFGGGSGQGLTLYVQQSDKTFRPHVQRVFEQDRMAEDIALALVDVDQDKDLDLIAITGSNEFEKEDALLADRLYINDGKGNFSTAADFPVLKGSGSCVVAADFDKDGDNDLFIGGRLIPGQYGYDAPSYLLINNGRGQFKNYTTRYIQNNLPGMVTDAVWEDIDRDGFPELIVVGDWMNITIYKNTGGKKLEPYFPVKNLDGWWNCIKATDVDNDGDSDFVVGNLGTNSRIRADSLHPASLYASDFDGNGAVEQVLNCVAQDGKIYPMALKHDLERQLPVIKRRFLKNDNYAGKTISEIFTKEELDKAVLKTVHESRSGVLRNDGGGKFVWIPFPLAAQVSPVFGIECFDVDGDGKNEILLAGNFYDVLPEIGRYDANYGIVLKLQSDGNFKVIPSRQSGFFMRGQTRSLRAVTIGTEKAIVAAKNNDNVQIYAR